jgi:rSAM/selenodomain-associated transferase 2
MSDTALSKSPSLSVVIPAINEADRIARAVRSAFDCGVGEVIVVDGGSNDETAELAGAAGATVVSSSPGRAVQQNVGATAAAGDVLLFLHADDYLAAEVGRQISTVAGRGGETFWGALRQRILDPHVIYRWIEWGNAWRVRYRRRPFGDQAMFVSRSLFESVGGFPDVPLLEDLILSRTLARIAPPVLLPGRVFVDARRWQRRGPLRQTLLNWRIQWQYAQGRSPAQLAELYRRHDLRKP